LSYKSASLVYGTSFDVMQLQRSLASTRDEIKAVKGNYSPRTINLMTKAAKRWDDNRIVHVQEISEMKKQLSLKQLALQSVSGKSVDLQKMMKKRTSAAKEDKMKVMMLSQDTAKLRQECQEQEEALELHEARFEVLSEQVEELEEANSNHKCIEEQLLFSEHNLQKDLRKADNQLQYDEVNIARHRKHEQDEQAVVEQLHADIVNCEMVAAQQPMPEAVHTEQALTKIMEDLADRERETAALEEQCQRLLSEEHEIESRLSSESSAALSRLASQLEGQWRSELEERERVLAELQGMPS